MKGAVKGKVTDVKLSPGAMTVLERRYLGRDETGRVVETPEQMWRRVASNVSEAEMLHGRAGLKSAPDDFFRIMSALEFLPNSPTLMNAGRRLQQIANGPFIGFYHSGSVQC